MSTRRWLAVGWVVVAAVYGAVIVPVGGFGLFAAGNVAWAVVGTLITLRRPGNSVGPLLVTAGFGWALAICADVGADRLADAGAVTAAGWLALVAMVATVPLLWITNVAIWLVFPTGRPATPLAAKLLRWSAWYLVAPAAAALVATPMVLGPGAPSQPHPVLGSTDVGDALWLLLSALLFPLGLVAIGLVLVRLRRAGPVERRQIGVVVVAVAAYLVLTLVNGLGHPLDSPERAFLVLDAVNATIVAAAFGVAILRFRLYDLDRILSRSLSFGALVAVIAALYVSLAFGVGQLLGASGGVVLSLLATAVVALLVQPVRARLERWADRLVYGPRATPQEVLSGFAQRAAALTDEELLTRVPRLVAEGAGARRATVWIRTDEGFRAAATWPVDATERTLEVADRFDDPNADRSLPIRHDGELLGGLSVDKEPGEALTPSESALLDHLAAALGVALANARLTAELREQVAALEASRERINTSADQARHDLEWTLEHGPHQQLVAVKVKLGPVRAKAERAGATKAAEFLGRLEGEAGEAIAAVRAFAAGIHPPTLTTEGLAAAVSERTSQLPVSVPVSVRDAGIPRAPIDVEAAVFYAVLEALQNATKHAQASSITVELSAPDGVLAFAVVDDGVGFDDATTAAGAGLDGIANRLAGVGGCARVESTPGAGTTVSGVVPLAGRSVSPGGSAGSGPAVGSPAVSSPG